MTAARPGRVEGEGDEPADPAPRPPRPGPEGLCPACPHVRRIVSDRGSVFLLCTLAREDPSLPRYPPQPRRACSGFPAG